MTGAPQAILKTYLCQTPVGSAVAETARTAVAASGAVFLRPIAARKNRPSRASNDRRG